VHITGARQEQAAHIAASGSRALSSSPLPISSFPQRNARATNHRPARKWRGESSGQVRRSDAVNNVPRVSTLFEPAHLSAVTNHLCLADLSNFELPT